MSDHKYSATSRARIVRNYDFIRAEDGDIAGFLQEFGITLDCIDRWRKKKKKKPASVRALTPSQVRQVRVAYSNGSSLRQLSREYGIAPRTVYEMVQRITYKDIE